MSKLLKVYKKQYYSIKTIFCVSLNEKVYFNNYGFNHLIRKMGRKRFLWDVESRFKLLVYIKAILISEKVKIVYRKGKIKYWALSKNMGGLNIKVILRKKRNGKLHFYSIYEE